MSIVPPDDPRYAEYAPDVAAYDDRYQDMPDDEFHGAICGCGRRMHEADSECSRCWRDREFPES
jgi:hypothetical protein